MFSCTECKKRFSFKSNLNRHKNGFHLNRTHSCELCGKNFKRNDALKIHETSGGCHPRRTLNVKEAGKRENCFEDYESVEGSNVDMKDELKNSEAPMKTDFDFDCVDEASSSRFFTKERSPLDMALYSLASNQVINPRDKMKCYLKIVGHHLGCKRANCSRKNVSEEDEVNYYEHDNSEEVDESGDESNSDTSEDKHDSSTVENQSGNGANRDIFGGALIDGMDYETSGEESNSEDEGSDDELEDTGDASNGDDARSESEEIDENEEGTLESADDEIIGDNETDEEGTIYEKVNINWPQYNVKQPWESYGERILLFDQLDWLRHIAASKSSLSLMKQIRHAEEPQIFALCEIALNLLMDHIPMTVDEFNCYKSQKDNLRNLAYGDYDWKRNRSLLSSNNSLVWILLVSIEPLY